MFPTGETSDEVTLSVESDAESDSDLDTFDPLAPSSGQSAGGSGSHDLTILDEKEHSSSESEEHTRSESSPETTTGTTQDILDIEQTDEDLEDYNSLENLANDDENSEELSEEHLEEGDVFEIRNSVSVLQHPATCRDRNHFNYNGSPPPIQPRQRLDAVPMLGRPIDERRPAVRERTVDIPGRLVTEGDLIRYFSGYLDDNGEQVLLTARVQQMYKTQQRKHPNHYNILNENGQSLSLSLVPGGNWAVRRDEDRWETY